jgi:hypothetical protein
MDEFHIFMGGMRSNKENHTITGKEAIKKQQHGRGSLSSWPEP